MFHLVHFMETALLMLVAYVLGCSLGYAAHRVLFAGRGQRRVTTAAEPTSVVARTVAPRDRRTMSPAARLAATGSDDPAPDPRVIPSSTTTRPPLAAPKSAPAPAPSAPASVAAKPRSDLSRPPAMAAPRSGGADNLKQIKGIGPKIEAALHELGIYHFDQIAAWSRANIDWVDGRLAFKGRIIRERWVEQAAQLARPSRISA